MAPPALSITTSKPRLALKEKMVLGESPVWDPDHGGRLFWVDVEGKKIHWLTPSDGKHRSVPQDKLTAAVILTPDADTVVAAQEQSIVEVDLTANGAVKSVLATVPREYGTAEDSWRFNDARAAPSGEIIGGRMSQEGWEDGVGGWVHRLAPRQQGATQADLSVVFQQGVLGLPNGMCWNMEKRVIYYNDTYTRKVHAIPTDSEGTPTADTSQWRTVLTFPEEEGAPDGMAIDAAGNVWIAHEQGGMVGCYDTETGERLHTIEMPVKRPSACAFGGPELQQLYITTISEEGDDASPDSGKLFVVDVEGVAGATPAHKYLL